MTIFDNCFYLGSQQAVIKLIWWPTKNWNCIIFRQNEVQFLLVRFFLCASVHLIQVRHWAHSFQDSFISCVQKVTQWYILRRKLCHYTWICPQHLLPGVSRHSGLNVIAPTFILSKVLVRASNKVIYFQNKFYFILPVLYTESVYILICDLQFKSSSNWWKLKRKKLRCFLFKKG